ncbi:MAG TPA: adenylate/guanylate cyclase domain-containing protein [Actinomycetota bacterium]
MKLPAGIVAFLFSDIQGSTRLLDTLGDDYTRILGEHRDLLRRAFLEHGGIEISTEGDSFFVAFERASDAVLAAVEAQRSLTRHEWPVEPLRVRMGIHAGEAAIHEDSYAGMAVHLAARVMSAAHGGQILITGACREMAGRANLEMRDLGEHTLKDIPERVRLLQVLHPDLLDSFPPPRTFDALRTNVPQHLPTLVGRESEIHAVVDALAAGRLVSLVGSGGSGKTRLALEVAVRTADRYADGAWLVEMAPLSDPDALAQVVAGVFSLRDQEGRTLEEGLVHFLAAREMLIVLDNCEHLIDAAAAFVARVLRDAPSTWILATSREPLAVAGEVARRLPSLGLPPEAGDVDQIAATDSVRLFVERARALMPAFELTVGNAADVARICTRLDGIPLAIELAAARMSAMDPAAIADRLGDRFRLLRGAGRGAIERQQTLRAAIDWSYKLLSPEERVALERLSVFVGGCTLDAAEGVCAEGLDSEVYELLSGLVAKSLVNAAETATGMRYSMLETIRQYAREKLADSDDAGATVARHAAFYARWSIAAEPPLEGVDQAEWLARVDAEAENTIAALSALLERGDAERALAVATALWRWWWLRGRWGEGSAWLRSAAAAAGWPKDSLGARCRWAIAFLNAFRGVAENADELLDEAERIQREAGDLRGLAYTLWARGWSSRDLDSRLRMLETALDYARRSGDGQVTGWTLGVLGTWVEDHDDSAPFHREAIEIARECGDHWTEAIELNNLGESLYYAGDFASAVPMIERSIEIFREIKDLFGLPEALRTQAMIAWLRGDPATLRARVVEARRMLAGTDGEGTLIEFLWPALRAELEAGNVEEAERIADEAGVLARRLQQRWVATLFQEMLRVASGDLRRSFPDDDQDLIGTESSLADARRSRLSQVLGANVISRYVGAERAAEQGDRARAAELAHAAGKFAVLKSPWDAAQVIDVLARLSEDPIWALTLFGAAEAARSLHGGKRLPRLGVVCGEAIDRACAAAGAEVAEQALIRGRTMTARETFGLDANERSGKS